MLDNGPVISIVDDDASIRQAIDDLIGSTGLRAITFASAEEFLRAEEAQATTCLILDLCMPGMDGRQLHERLRRDGHRIPVILLTAHGDDAVRSWARGAGVAAFLSKPFDAEVLLSAVAAILRST
jgi:FixJ family two-component response regulator